MPGKRLSVTFGSSSIGRGLDPVDPSGPVAARELGGQRRALARGREVDVVGLTLRAVVRAPARSEQVARTHVGSGPVEERAGVVDHTRRPGRVAEQAVEPLHENRDPVAPLGCSRIAAQHVEDDRRGPLGGGGDDVLRDHGVIAPRELGRPGGVGGSPEDVAHLRRLRQGMEVCRGGGIPRSARCVPGGSVVASRAARWASAAAVRWRRDRGAPSAKTRAASRAAAGRGSSGWTFSKITRAGAAHATAYAATARSSSVVTTKSPESVSICRSFAQRADRCRSRNNAPDAGLRVGTTSAAT